MRNNTEAENLNVLQFWGSYSFLFFFKLTVRSSVKQILE